MAADPARAEQQKYAKEQVERQKKEKEIRENILANIADDRAKVKERAERERLIRSQNEEKGNEAM